MTLSVDMLTPDQRAGIGAAFVIVGWANIFANGAIVAGAWLFKRTLHQPDRILCTLAIGYLFNSILWAFAPTFFNPGHGGTCFFMMMHTFGRFSTVLMELLILVFAVTSLLNENRKSLWKWWVEVLSYLAVHLMSFIITVVYGTTFAWPCGNSESVTAIDKVDHITELWLAILAICLVASFFMMFRYRQLQIRWKDEDNAIETGWLTSSERHQKVTIMKVHKEHVAAMVEPLLAYPLVFLLFAIPDIVKVSLDSQWSHSQKKELVSACINLFVGLRGIAFAIVFFLEGDNRSMLSWKNIKRKWRSRHSTSRVNFGSDNIHVYDQEKLPSSRPDSVDLSSQNSLQESLLPESHLPDPDLEEL